jgi:hypothetical protein
MKRRQKSPLGIRRSDATVFLCLELEPEQADAKFCNGAFGVAVMCMRFRTEMVRIEVLTL